MNSVETPAIQNPQFMSVRARARRFSLDGVLKYFFRGNATVAIIVLLLITVFLFKEGTGFFSQNKQNLKIYRMAGLELVDIIRAQVSGHSKLTRELSDIRLGQFNLLVKEGKNPEEANVALEPFDAFATTFSDASGDLQTLVSDLTEVASAIKEKAKINEDLKQEKQMYLSAGRLEQAEQISIVEIDLTKEIEPLMAGAKAHHEVNRAFVENLHLAMQSSPVLPDQTFQSRLQQFGDEVNQYIDSFGKTSEQLQSWKQDKPVPFYSALSSFVLGREWITNSFWQDWYGIVPLFVGSVMVSIVALMIAVPLGVCSAIYVSEIAHIREQQFIKPAIEFISAIPSVVLGFFGIAVLGQTIRWVSQLSFLDWIPFFPLSERLNIFTAGCLLALMAVPTIFSLSEDAINNIPRAFKEASYALGATRLQTLMRILIPASLSGIVAAILLGFGRVIGETMVVLLCAGNRIAIPDFSEGVGAFFQPVHTMTGIIAQEMGEVVNGSIHYRALFMVGMVLFTVTLLINYLAQKIVRKYRIQ